MFRAVFLSETCTVLFQKWIWEISASGWFYYKNISRCMVLWMSKKLVALNLAFRIWFNFVTREHDLYAINICIIATKLTKITERIRRSPVTVYSLKQSPALPSCLCCFFWNACVFLCRKIKYYYCIMIKFSYVCLSASYSKTRSETAIFGGLSTFPEVWEG